MDMNLANKLTLLRVIMIPAFLLVLFLAPEPMGRYIAVVIFIVASLTDMLDGKIARKYNMVSNFGKFMDPLADKLLVMSATHLRNHTIGTTVVAALGNFQIRKIRCGRKHTQLAVSILHGKVNAFQLLHLLLAAQNFIRNLRNGFIRRCADNGIHLGQFVKKFLFVSLP